MYIMHIREWKNAMRLGQGRKWLVERRKNCKRYMYQLCGTKRYVWIKLCAKVDGFSLIFSLMQKVNGGYWRLNCNEEVLLFYKEMWKCSIFYRKNDKTIEFKSLCPCQWIASNCSDYWLFSLPLYTFRLKKFGKCNTQKISPIFPPYREQVTGGWLYFQMVIKCLHPHGTFLPHFLRNMPVDIKCKLCRSMT